MSVTTSGSAETRREEVTPFRLSDHVHNRLRYNCDERCVDREVLNEVILNGDHRDNPDGRGDTAIVYEVAGITFEAIVDTVDREVITAYPTQISRFEAITSNRWTQTQIRSIERRVRQGKMEMV